MIQILSKLFARRRDRRPAAIYVAGTLAGERMTPQQIASAVQSQRDMPGVRGVIQVIEAYAAESLALASNENAIRDNMAGRYLMAHGWLTYVLTDLRDYTAGRVPDMPAKPRAASRPKTGDE